MQIRKRDGRIVDFDQSKITEAIWKAVQSVGGIDKEQSERLAVAVRITAFQSYKDIIDVETIQDLVEKTLVENGHYKTAKSYILFRQQRKDTRDTRNLLDISIISDYVEQNDWRIKENSNMTYSLQGMNFHTSSLLVSQYWLNKIYPYQVRKAQIDGDMHIHDLGILGVYCVGWDLQDLLREGFKGVRGKIASKPAKHFRSALGQIVNFFYTLQGEAAGAQAFSNFDTLLAPYVCKDGLTYAEVKQAMQEFLFNMNVPTRVGFQTPFTNITMDLICPDHIKEEPVNMEKDSKGNYLPFTYGDYQEEMDMINTAFAECMLEGDADGRVFTFPIPTYNITESFDWENKTYEKIWEMTAKYGIPYFSNFIGSDMNPEDARSMCCRLRLDNRELQKRNGGLFASTPLTGSIGVVTINLPKIGYEQDSYNKFFEQLDKVLETAKISLEIKRKVLEQFTENGLYPYSQFYLRNTKERYGEYWKNHFSTIGVVGMNECCLNYTHSNEGIDSKAGTFFVQQVLNHIREKLHEFQEETSNLYNLESTPAEGVSYRMAKADKSKYPNLIVANDHEVLLGAEPYYTNSTNLPVYFTDDLFEALRHQEPIQALYTGGTVFHMFVGEKQPDINAVRNLIKKVCTSFTLPYFTLTPTFSICPSHGYIYGEHQSCPNCGLNTEVYSRVVGYIRPVEQWNNGKQAEFAQRKYYDKILEVAQVTKDEVS